jgi:hypothetical protein
MAEPKITATFEIKGTIPEKQAETMRATCPFCGNPFAEHSIEDHKACAEKQAGR